MVFSDPPNGAPLLHIPITVNSTAVRLSWKELNCTHRGGGMITGYIILYISEGIQSTVNVTADTTSIELTGLTEYGLYSVSVAAINDYGIGPYSGAQNVYTCKLLHALAIVYIIMYAYSDYFWLQ